MTSRPLIRVRFELVRGCPYACGACTPPKRWVAMSLRTIRASCKAVEIAARAMQNAFVVLHLHGWGEPSLRPDLAEAVLEVRTALPNALLVMSSNGFDPERVATCDVDRVILGLDSLNPAVHSLTRGWPLTNSLRLLSTVDIRKITVTSLVHVGNVQDVLRVSDLLSTSVRHVVMRYCAHPIGGTTRYDGPPIITRQHELLETLQGRGYDISEQEGARGSPQRYECAIGYDGAFHRCMSTLNRTRETLAQVFENNALDCIRCGHCDTQVAVRVGRLKP